MLAKKGFHKPGTCFSVFEATKVIIPGKFLKYNAINELAIQACSGQELQAIGGFYLASNYIVSRNVFLRNLLNINFVQVVLFLAIILSIYFMFIFFTRKTHELKYFYISLMSFFYVFNSVNIAFFYDYANGLLLAKFSRIGLPLATAFLGLFVVAFTGILSRARWLRGVILVPAALAALRVVFFSTKYEVYAFFTNVTANFIILPILVFCLVLLIISLFKHKYKYSFPIFIGFLVIFICSSHDLTKLSNFEIPYFWATPYGYTLQMVGIFFVLANEEAAVNRRLEDRQASINSKNESLRQIIENIKIVSAKLNDSYARLKKIIENTILVITRYERNNRQLKENSESRYQEITSIINKLTARLDVSDTKVPKAIISQKKLARTITETLKQMNLDLENTLSSSADTNTVAHGLADMAENSSNVVLESKNIINKISEYSQFISQVLTTIEDITERTKILSINAAIEAVKAGSVGKGFAVIAHEIRLLAFQSQGNLESSFSNIYEVQDTLRKSTGLADKVSGSLLKIIVTSQESATMIDEITGHIRDQKYASVSILESVDLFIKETDTINRISEEELDGSEEIKYALMGLQATFKEITTQLNEQINKGTELQHFLNEINRLMQDSMQHITILKEYTG